MRVASMFSLMRLGKSILGTRKARAKEERRKGKDPRRKEKLVEA